LDRWLIQAAGEYCHLPGRVRPSVKRQAGSKATTETLKAMPKIDPFKFLQEVRAEAQKVTWPTRKETTVTTIMVFVMVAVASIFFLLADQVMRIAVGFLLGINS
jgi:preprotein translocase subunit SecE